MKTYGTIYLTVRLDYEAEIENENEEVDEDDIVSNLELVASIADDKVSAESLEICGRNLE